MDRDDVPIEYVLSDILREMEQFYLTKKIDPDGELSKLPKILEAKRDPRRKSGTACQFISTETQRSGY